MKCLQCDHSNPANAMFCLQCGSAFAIVCRNCGIELPANAKFCLECGTKVEAATRATSELLPHTYTPKHLADKILTSRTAIEGERKQVTVLFADLTGSMELLADRDPEEARAVLDPVLGHMMDAVHAYDGTVNQVMGDGIMALFGAPLALEDHAVRACYAAKRMQERISRYGDEVQRKYGVPIQLRIGLHSGDVVVRSIGSDLKMDYSAIGQTTHLAARMEQTTKPGTILATTDTVRLAEGFIQVRPLGPVAVKGMSEPVEVFELTGALMRRSRMQARAASGGFTQFVGRQREFEVLAEAAKNAKDGKGQVVATVGEPGVGKSRLFWEFTHSHHTQGCAVVEASSVSYGKATSFLPVIDLLKSYFQIGERDDARSVREKLTGKLLTLDRRLETALSPILALLDQPVEDEKWSQLEPPQRRRQTLEALTQLWLREAQNQPLVLVFEDLHWIDSETQTFLNELLEKIPTTSILLLFNYRPEYQCLWGSKSFYTQLRLNALPVESTSELLTALLGPDPALEPLKEMLVKRGNPFFLEETVRTLIETGTLEGERGAFRLAHPVASLQIPATVQAILAARIDRLAPDDKRVLQTASVIGKDVPFELLKAIADTSDTELNNALARLQAAEFIYEAGLYPDVEYTFKHALTHEVAYSGLTHGRKQQLHAHIVDAIEQVYANRIDEHTERLAHHAQRGEVWDKAVRYLRQAGIKALARSANREAAKAFDEAAVAIEKLPQTPEILKQAVDLYLAMRVCVTPLADMKTLLRIAQRAADLNSLIDDRRREVLLSGYHSAALTNLGETRKALPFATQSLSIAQSLGDRSLIASANFFSGMSEARRGSLRSAVEHFDNDANIDIDELVLDAEHRSTDRLMEARSVLTSRLYANVECSFVCTDLGEFGAAMDRANEAMKIAEKVGQVYFHSMAQIAKGAVYSTMGEHAAAVLYLEQGITLAEATDYPGAIGNGAWALANAYNLTGRPSDAVRLAKRAWNLVEPVGFLYFGALSLLELARGYSLTGEPGLAVNTIERTESLAQRTGFRGLEVQANYMRGEILMRVLVRDVVSRARTAFEAAIAMAHELEMKPVTAHSHAGLGRLSHAMGKKAEARDELSRACNMYRDMGMTYYLNKAEEDLANLN